MHLNLDVCVICWKSSECVNVYTNTLKTSDHRLYISGVTNVLPVGTGTPARTA